jgi:hypothetical protein
VIVHRLDEARAPFGAHAHEVEWAIERERAHRPRWYTRLAF